MIKLRLLYRPAFRRAVFCLIVGILPCIPATARMEDITLRGVVVDGETESPLPFSNVRVVELNLTQATDSLGVFSFTDINPGEYTMEVSLVGYRKTTFNARAKPDGANVFYIHVFPVPIQTAGVVVTGEHHDSRIDEVHESSHLRGKELQRDLGQTLASTLKNETGLAIRSMGPAPARPVIRGLGGDRIIISEDGTKTSDLSATSPDHAVTVEPFTVDRIEVVRGPRVLLRGSTTIGGAVNIVRDEIPRVVGDKISGNIGLFGESANSGYLGSAVAVLPLKPFVVRGEASKRKSGNLRTPTGRLMNSDAQTTNYGFGFSIVPAWGMAGVSFREYDTDYGIPGGFVGAHPKGVDISIFKRQINGKATMSFNGGWFENIHFEAGRTYYHHTEFESSGLVGAEFSIYTYTGRLQLNHRSLGPCTSGAWGISAEHRDFSVGGFVFTPATTSLNTSAFVFEEFTLVDVDVQLAARLNHDRLTPDRDDPSARIGHIRARAFTTYALSGSVLYDLSGRIYVGTTISKSSRVPTIEELYSEGPHLAAYSYEVGNPNLKDEHGFGSELFAYYKGDAVFFMVTGFYNDLPYYIVSQNTGRINFTTLLPVHAANGISARLYGVESQADWNITSTMKLSSSFSYTHGSAVNADHPLPTIPPFKGLAGLQYSTPEFSLGVSAEIAAAQRRVDRFEDPTAGYIMFNGFTQFTFDSAGLIHSVSCTIDNVFNKEYRNHLSRVKVIMPEAGRTLRVTYRLFF